MKRGWFYRRDDRMIIHQQNADSSPLPIGRVPKIIGQIVHLTDDGESIRIEYLVLGHRQRRGRILTEDELDRGTWSAKLGYRRPTGNDERHAYARLIREEGENANVIPARTYYDEEGSLIFPAAEAQNFGYRVLRGTEEQAREAWEEIGAYTTMCGKSALVLGAMMIGPALDSLDVLAHVLNCYGPGQQGKSTVMTVACSILGDLKPRSQQLMTTWNSSKQGITQSLRQRGFLPMGLDEHSASGRKIKESSREISQMVSGAVRMMGSADGSPRESDGFWLSLLLSTSNEQLKFEGQTEDLASRLQEISAPFYPDRMVLSNGDPAPAGHHGAEHVSKRLKRLARSAGGWPLEWAIRADMFHVKNLGQLKNLHLELTAKYRPANGGIAATIAELHTAWVVGAYMLGEAIGVPGIGEAAEAEAAERLAVAIEVAAEANIPDSERLWNALDSLRIEAATFPEMEALLAVAEDGRVKPRGFYTTAPAEEGGGRQWWVVDPVVRQAAADAEIDNLTAALQILDGLGVHVREKGKHAQRQLPRAIRRKGNLPGRMHCFDLDKADGHFAPDDAPEGGPGGGSGGEFPGGTTPRNHPGTTGVVPDSEALTSSGTTGTTGTTLELFNISREGGTTPGTTLSVPAQATSPEEVYGEIPGYSEAGQNEDQEDVVLEAPAPVAASVVFAPARMYQPGDSRMDEAFLKLAFKAKGRTASALNFGVLGDGYMYLPNHEPVPVALPSNVDQVPALMDAYGLKTLWVHQSGAQAMGLPTFEERRVMPALGKEEPEDQEEEGEEERKDTRSPQNAVAHPWATPSGNGPVDSMAAEGLSSWMTLVCGKGEQERRLYVSLPLYENRFDKGGKRGGFGGPDTPEVMLDALMVWTLSTVSGSEDRPSVIPFYMSVNRTAEDFAGGRGRTDVLCDAVRRREVEPVLRNKVPLMVPQQWHRKLSEAEQGLAAVHRFDKSAAWLGAFSNIRLGIGEPVHGGPESTYEPLVPGFWRVSQVPGHGPEGLPELRFREAAQGGYWISTPNIALLLEKDMYPEWVPDVLEAWYWPEHKRALEGMYDRVRIARKRIVAAVEAGRPGAKWVKGINGRVYQSFRGYLDRNSGPMTDQNGGDYRKDIFYRPDWARLIMDQGTANLYRNLLKFHAAGHLPLSVCVDAVTYASSEDDHKLAKPADMALGSAGGQWTHEGSAPLGAVLDAVQAGRNVHHVLNDYIKTQGE